MVLLNWDAALDVLHDHVALKRRLERALTAGDEVALCQPVLDVVQRALLGPDQVGRRYRFEHDLRPRLGWVEITPGEKRQTAKLYELTRAQGLYPGSAALIVAALALRLDAVVVTSDPDFDAMGVRREDWRGG